MNVAQIAARIRQAMQPKRYALPSEAEQYARKAKYAPNQQEFRWITIGAQDREGGGTHVQIKSSTGEIVAGPDALTGKKVGELGKKPEPKAKGETSDRHPLPALVRKPPKVDGGGPLVASENARPTARILSPSDQAAAWRDIHGGPLGKVLGLGERPHRIKWGHGVMSKYIEVANGFENPEQRFSKVAKAAEEIAKRHNPDSSWDDWEYLTKTVKDTAEDDLAYAPRQHQSMLTKNPSILLARRWIEEAIQSSHQDINELVKIHSAFYL